MKFNTHYGKGILSKLIRIFSRGKYNHTSIELRNHIYEAHIHTEVRKVPKCLWDNSSVVASQTLKISPEREQEVYTFLESQVGKKYDILGVLTFVWPFLKQKQGKWFCSEIAYVALMKALGIDSKEVLYNQRVSPHEFWCQLNVIKNIYA